MNGCIVAYCLFGYLFEQLEIGSTRFAQREMQTRVYKAAARYSMPPLQWRQKEKKREREKNETKQKPKGEKGNADTKSMVKKIRARILHCFHCFMCTDRYVSP